MLNAATGTTGNNLASLFNGQAGMHIKDRTDTISVVNTCISRKNSLPPDKYLIYYWASCSTFYSNDQCTMKSQRFYGRLKEKAYPPQ